MSPSDRERQLERENVDLRTAVAALRQEVADLRASSKLWRQLYEEAMRRLAELGNGNQ